LAIAQKTCFVRLIASGVQNRGYVRDKGKSIIMMAFFLNDPTRRMTPIRA